MRGTVKFRRIPRRLRRREPGSLLPKIIVLLAAALLLRLFFSLLGVGAGWAKSVSTDFFNTALSAELGAGLGNTLSVFGRSSLVNGGSTLLSGMVSYPFRMAADDGFTGEFPDNPAAEGGDSSDAVSTSGDNDASADPDTTVTGIGDPVSELSDSNSDATAPVLSTDGNTSQQTDAVDNDPNVRTVTISPSSSAGYDYSDAVYIKNETDFDIDVQTYLENKPEIDPTTDGPVILIVHTHASEAYYPDGNDIYTPTDTERTNDKNYNMIRVGDEMAAAFKARGYEALHIREIYDYPSYTGSYTRTLKAIEKALKENPTIQIVIDVHRDAMVAASGSTYRTIAEINDKKAAQILIVMGTSEGGLKHPSWKKNLTLAVHLQKQLSSDYPLLARPINLRAERFNQHASFGSMLVEMGTSSNTLQEALYSTALFTDSFCSLLDSLK